MFCTFAVTFIVLVQKYEPQANDMAKGSKEDEEHKISYCPCTHA